jgi:hypothetical protein
LDKGGFGLDIPVDDAFSAIMSPFSYNGQTLGHRIGQPGIQREPLPRIIEGLSDGFPLFSDQSRILSFPAPRDFKIFLPTQIITADLLGPEFRVTFAWVAIPA